MHRVAQHGPLIGILLLAAALRLYDLERYPDWIHHDHSIVGEYARNLTWAQLSTRWYSVGGWWLALTTGAIWIFGDHVWVLRLTAALSGIAIVWLVYHLGCSPWVGADAPSQG